MKRVRTTLRADAALAGSEATMTTVMRQGAAMRVRVSLLCAVVALSASACATEIKRNTSNDLAATPEQAAITFDKSLRAKDESGTDFVCPDITELALGTVRPLDEVGPARYSAHSTKVGTHWRVTVSVEYSDGPFADPVYDVQRRKGGYCVSDQLSG